MAGASQVQPGRFWLLKSEPDYHEMKGVDVSYSFDRLKEEKVASFFGVRNFQARNFLRDQVKVGDLCFFYHSSCKVPGIAGVAEVARPNEFEGMSSTASAVKGSVAGYPDEDATKPGHPFYDEKHTDENPRWFKINLQYVRHLERFIELSELRAESSLADMKLLRQSRLSVSPVTPAEWSKVLAMAAAPPGSKATAPNASSSSKASGVHTAAPSKAGSKRRAAGSDGGDDAGTGAGAGSGASSSSSAGSVSKSRGVKKQKASAATEKAPMHDVKKGSSGRRTKKAKNDG